VFNPFRHLYYKIQGIVKLPVTLEEFDSLATQVIKKFNLKDEHHAAAIMSIAIRHLPNEQAFTRIDYLGHYIMKNIANYVANHKAETLKHVGQVTHLVTMLETEPNNQQAWDELTKAADQGSEIAKTAIEKLHAKMDVAVEKTQTTN
jgi:hypothetical protein